MSQAALNLWPEDPSEQLDPMEDRDRDWLDALRLKLVELYEHRVNTWGIEKGEAYVCADDARRLMRHHPELSVPAGTSNNALGCLFRTKGWVRVGYTKSLTKGAHGNLISKWIWRPAS